MLSDKVSKTEDVGFTLFVVHVRSVSENMVRQVLCVKKLPAAQLFRVSVS